MLQTSCSESKPADSRLAFLTLPFTLSCCHCMQTRAWKPLLVPVYPVARCNPTRRHSTWANKAGAARGCSSKPACFHAKHARKTNKPKHSSHSAVLAFAPFSFFFFFPVLPLLGTKLAELPQNACGDDEFSPAWIWTRCLACPPAVRAGHVTCETTPICPHTPLCSTQRSLSPPKMRGPVEICAWFLGAQSKTQP